MSAGIRIGLDFDNTIITYDDVFLATARERGLVDASFSGRKQAIRDAIRLQPGGELTWQKLQGRVYGRGIAQAGMFKGVDSFLRRCRNENVPVMIVSHKTEFGHYDPARLNLRDAAREWMTKQGFFSDAGYGIAHADVYFEGTRQDKVARIAQLGCTHFIDDLAEVLSDPEFPSGVERILFTQERAAPGPYFICPTWRDVEQQVFRVFR